MESPVRRKSHAGFGKEGACLPNQVIGEGNALLLTGTGEGTSPSTKATAGNDLTA